MSNEDRLEHVLEVLGVLSRLTENKRLFLKNKNLYIESNRTLKIVSRWWYKERERCFDYIKEIVNEAIDMSQTSLDKWAQLTNSYIEQQRQMRQYGRLTQSLEAAIYGIQTQLVTYKNDERYCSRVEVLVNKMRDKLSDMELKVQMMNLAPTLENQEAVATPLTIPKVKQTPAPTTTTSDSSNDSEVELEF